MRGKVGEYATSGVVSHTRNPAAFIAASLSYTFLLLNGHMESYWDSETFIEKVIEKTKAELEQA